MIFTLLTDHTGKRYNIEMQRADRGAGAKRARYHSSLIDANITEPGDRLENLSETYVIFITERDVMGDVLPIYHINRTAEKTEKKFQDEAHIIYVNGAYRDKSSLGILMHDFACTDPNDIIYKVLAERVRYFKEDEEGVATMCKAMVLDGELRETQTTDYFSKHRRSDCAVRELTAR